MPRFYFLAPDACACDEDGTLSVMDDSAWIFLMFVSVEYPSLISQSA